MRASILLMLLIGVCLTWLFDPTSGEASGLIPMQADILNETNPEKCLALAIYFEARNQPLAGRLAVAQVILNRVADKHFPSTVCAVIQQPHQFSFSRDGRSDTPYDLRAYADAETVAELMLNGLVYKPALDAEWYHDTSMHPVWADKLREILKVGDLIFYDRRGIVR